jgi:hypothetical protein
MINKIKKLNDISLTYLKIRKVIKKINNKKYTNINLEKC